MYFGSKNIKMKNNEFKKVRVKSRPCYYFDYIIKMEDFDFNNFLTDENHTKIFLFITFHIKL